MTEKELKAVTKLYVSIFWSTLSHGDIEEAKKIGDIALRTAKSIKAPELVVSILPKLMYICLLTKDVDAALDILDELYLFAIDANNDHQSTYLCYLAQCMAFHLETGNVIRSYDECEQFFQEMSCEDFINIKDTAVKKHFCVTMWLWCIRNCNWDRATFWYSEMEEFCQFDIIDDTDAINQITKLYLLEGMITALAYKKKYGNDEECCRYFQKIIEKLIEGLEEAAKHMEIILPRLYHMKAYYRIVRRNDASKGFKYLEKAHNLAVKYNNILEEEWVEHSWKVWNSTIIGDATLKFWQQHCNKHHKIERNNGKFVYFPLIFPIYIRSINQ